MIPISLSVVNLYICLYILEARHGSPLWEYNLRDRQEISKKLSLLATMYCWLDYRGK